jgi:hypothetical protein
MVGRIVGVVVVVIAAVVIFTISRGDSATAATTDLQLKELLCSDKGSHCVVSGPDDEHHAGETLAYSVRLVSSEDGRRVGVEQGTCVKLRRSSEESYCDFVAHLLNGDLTVQGTFATDGSQSFLTITGGTGAYEGASGYWRQHGQNLVLHIVTP